jgi:flagellin-specific chaperone FliS
MMRVLDIVGELLAGVRQTTGEPNDQLAAMYWFIFRRISEATMDSNAAALAEALRLLEFERETWQKVCEKFGGSSDSTATAHAPHIVEAERATISRIGLSLEA